MAVVSHVSDTARWVAVYRAIESERKDALFHDPFAKELAGDLGHEIVDSLPGRELTGWPIIVRTAVFDEMILRAVHHAGVDLVINLAAGLDTRPYRLDLPESLRWVEVDLPGIIAHKEAVLAEERPRCQLDRVVCDLADVDARRAVLARVTEGAKSVFVLTEGLVMYLTEEQLASLASDLAMAPVHFWAMDLMGPYLRMAMNFMFRLRFGPESVSFHFSPHDGPGFFRPFGWRVVAHRGTDEEAIRLKRLPLIARPWGMAHRFYPKFYRDRLRRGSGYLLLERAQ